MLNIVIVKYFVSNVYLTFNNFFFSHVDRDRMRSFILEAVEVWFVYTAIPLVYFEKSSRRLGRLFSCTAKFSEDQWYHFDHTLFAILFILHSSVYKKISDSRLGKST